MSLTFPVSGSTSIGTNEYSLSSLTITGAPFAQTDDAWVSIVMEVSTLTAGDRFILTPYEKAYSGGTQRAGQPIYIAGPPAAPLLEFGPFRVKHGWDFTVKKDTGTDRVIGASLHQNLSSGGGTTLTAGDLRIAPWAGNYTYGQPIYLYIPSRTQTGAPITYTGTPAFTVWRDGSATQRTSSAGITIDDDFDAVTGLHKVTIDTTDDTDVGFWRRGSHYVINISGFTVNTVTSLAVSATFGIELEHESLRMVVGGVFQNTGSAQATLASGYVTATDSVKGWLLQALETGEGRVITSADTDDLVQVASWVTEPADTSRYNLYAGEPAAGDNPNVNLASADPTVLADIGAAVGDETGTDLTTLPGITGTIRDLISAIYAALHHKRTINSSTGATVVKQSDGATDLGTGTDADDGTTYTRGPVS